MSISLEEDQKARLDALAESRSETTAEIVAEALDQYLAYDTAFRAAVEEGLAANRAGDVSDFEEFASAMRRRMAIKVAEADA
jgi:predicted transcriptional regulator